MLRNNEVSSNKLFFCFSGIRSQSKPQDVMAEVYKAMLSLGYVRYTSF